MDTRPITRRHFVLTTAAAAGLTACGSGDELVGSPDATAAAADAEAAAAGDASLVGKAVSDYPSDLLAFHQRIGAFNDFFVNRWSPAAQLILCNNLVSVYETTGLPDPGYVYTSAIAFENAVRSLSGAEQEWVLTQSNTQIRARLYLNTFGNYDELSSDAQSYQKWILEDMTIERLAFIKSHRRAAWLNMRNFIYSFAIEGGREIWNQRRLSADGYADRRRLSWLGGEKSDSVESEKRGWVGLRKDFFFVQWGNKRAPIERHELKQTAYWNEEYAGFHFFDKQYTHEDEVLYAATLDDTEKPVAPITSTTSIETTDEMLTAISYYVDKDIDKYGGIGPYNDAYAPAG